MSDLDGMNPSAPSGMNPGSPGQLSGTSGVSPSGMDGYSQINSWVWDLLNQTSTTLPYTVLQKYTDSAVNRLLDVYPALISYSNLQQTGGTDIAFFNEGVGHLVAIRIRRKNPKLALGENTRLTQGPIEYDYAPTKQNKTSLEEEWLEDARLALGRVSAIKAEIASRAASFSRFIVTGPSRTARENGYSPTLLSSVIRLLSEDVADNIEGERTEDR